MLTMAKITLFEQPVLQMDIDIIIVFKAAVKKKSSWDIPCGDIVRLVRLKKYEIGSSMIR